MTPKSRERTKFVADAMLGSLSRKLRIFGFDVTYYNRGGDSEIMEIANSERRILISSDQDLISKAQSADLPALLVSGTTDSSRIVSLASAAKDAGIELVRGEAMCSVCGGSLLQLERKEVSGRVPPLVFESHRLFFVCGTCGRYYWRGSHWKKLRWLESRLGEKTK